MSALRRLHRDERAQVSFLAVAAALCFVGLFSMVMNTSDLLRHRIQVQEAADVTALTAATWHARGMNLVAMTNVINSKLLTVTVLSKALDPTFTAVLKIAKAQIAAKHSRSELAGSNASRSAGSVPFIASNDHRPTINRRAPTSMEPSNGTIAPDRMT